MVHFAENEGGYYSTYWYVCKHDNAVFHSETHPNLNGAGSPGTKKAMHGYTRRHHSQAQQKIENSNLTVTNEAEPISSTKKKSHHLTITEVSDICIENDIKNRTQLLAMVGEQKRLRPCYICTQSQQKDNL